MEGSVLVLLSPSHFGLDLLDLKPVKIFISNVFRHMCTEFESRTNLVNSGRHFGG